MSRFSDSVYNKNHQVKEYHGLRNQGSTCYLNSVLQVLFMTKDFREAVGRCPDGCEELIDHQLDRLFESLEETTGETNEVTQKLGIHQVNEQRDAAEYLEKILTMASQEAAKIFEVQLIDRTLCWDCKENTEEEKSFWNLLLPLKHSSDEHYENYDVREAIKEFFKDSHFTEDNQLYCETCEDKCDATTKCVVKHHPEVLMLLLKRFEFNYHQMSLVKNTRVVDFPFTLKIPENQAYELYAYVEHFGSLHSGHYTATIKSQDEDRWYNFNDSCVRVLNNPPFQEKKTERSKSAYLLFYRKKGAGEQSNRREPHQELGLPDNNKNSSFKNVCNSEKSQERNNPIEEISDPRHKKNHTSGNENGAKNPLGDDNRVRSQSSDEQGKTSVDDNSCPKPRKTCEKVDRAGKEPTGRKSEEKVNNQSTRQESGGFRNPQHIPKQERHEQRENLAQQGKYNIQGKSTTAIQTNQEQKSNVKVDVHGDGEKPVNKHSQMEEGAGSKPNPKISTDKQHEKCGPKTKKQQEQKHLGKRKSDKKRVNSPTPTEHNLTEEKQSVDSKKGKKRSKRFSWKIWKPVQKREKKSKKGKGHLHEDNKQNAIHNDEEEKTKSSILCFGRSRKNKPEGFE